MIDKDPFALQEIAPGACIRPFAKGLLDIVTCVLRWGPVPAGNVSGLACLRHVLLKLTGLARLRLFRSGVLHLRPSCYIKWITVLRVHVSLTFQDRLNQVFYSGQLSRT
ncbi:hypothetical protein ACVIWV_005755 [Bradyrhizobium diazoefficiens]